jgi:uncharacterized protein YeaO (DUF488 family)
MGSSAQSHASDCDLFSIGNGHDEPARHRAAARGDRSSCASGGDAIDIRLKRVYESPAQADGYRVLIDRLWPRGISKADAELDEWAKELAPSTELRTWFGHDPGRFAEFRRRYAAELDRQRPRLAELRRRAKRGRLTLLYSARDREHNDAVVLAGILRQGPPTRADRRQD